MFHLPKIRAVTPWVFAIGGGCLSAFGLWNFFHRPHGPFSLIQEFRMARTIFTGAVLFGVGVFWLIKLHKPWDDSNRNKDNPGAERKTNNGQP